MPRSPRSPWHSLGAPVEKYVELGMAYAAHAVELTPTLPAPIRAQRVNPAQLIAMVFNSELPPELSRVILDISRGPACLFVLAAALAPSRPFAPWLTIDVAERFMLSQRGTLCIFATIPGVKVSETLLPLEHRIDVPRAIAEHIGRLQSWDRLPLQTSLPAD